jgi:O-antigen/teichoic acid export membrane protein
MGSFSVYKINFIDRKKYLKKKIKIIIKDVLRNLFSFSFLFLGTSLIINKNKKNMFNSIK